VIERKPLWNPCIRILDDGETSWAPAFDPGIEMYWKPSDTSPVYLLQGAEHRKGIETPWS
jgi:hypothetical protein